MIYCKSCVTPNTRPDLTFKNGICDACNSFKNKNTINWSDRKNEFKKLIKDYHKNNDTYDCLIPVSGGKDSHLTLHHALENNLKPLCFSITPTIPTEIGLKNLKNISNLGVDLIQFTPNPKVYNHLVLEGFKRVGDMEWINHMSIWSIPVHFAIKMNIKLILWGESPQMEYGGSMTISELNKKQFTEEWVNDYGALNGLRAQDMVCSNPDNFSISERDMDIFEYPNKIKVEKWGGIGVFMGYYFKWNDRKNLEIIEKMGFSRKKGRIEISYTDYEKLDCISMNLHDYLKYLKFGYGRATDAASIEIRNNIITREEGIRLVEKYDRNYPKYSIETFCEKFKISQKEFDLLASDYINPDIFIQDEKGEFIRDIDGSYLMKENVKKAIYNQ